MTNKEFVLSIHRDAIAVITDNRGCLPKDIPWNHNSFLDGTDKDFFANEFVIMEVDPYHEYMRHYTAVYLGEGFTENEAWDSAQHNIKKEILQKLES